MSAQLAPQMPARQLLCAPMLQAFARSCKPRQRRTVSEWSDAHRMLSSKGSSAPGPWRTSRTPYLREIMDSLSDFSPVEIVTIIKCTQTGGTEVALNWIGYTIDHDPAPMLVVVPTLEVLERWSIQRLQPLLTETPVLTRAVNANASRNNANKLNIKDFPNGLLVLGGANSAASLGSMPIEKVVLDEVDRFPWEVGKEGDPLELIHQRQSNWPRRKTLEISTPTIKDASRIDESYQRSDRRRYHVPCPHCDARIVLVWGNLQWDSRLTEARYVCPQCGAEIGEHSKRDMLENGVWIPEAPEVLLHRGYHINGLYAPLGLGFTWIELARKWIKAQHDKSKLKTFINTTLGEVYEDRTRDIKANALATRAEPYALRTIPLGCYVLTSGVDVQGDRFEIKIKGFGRNGVRWTIDYLVLPCDPSKDDAWLKLAEYLNRPITNAYGKALYVQASLIDSGGHHTHEVYQFVRSLLIRRPMAGKGANTPGKPILAARPSNVDVNHRGKVIKDGAQLWIIGTDTAKHAIFNALASDAECEPGDRRMRFSQDLDHAYYDGLVSEVFDPEKNRWIKRRGKRNEPLDTEVYAIAASMHPELRVHAMRKSDWDRLQAALEPREQQPEEQPQAQGAQKPAPEQRRGRARVRRGSNFVKGWKQ